MEFRLGNVYDDKLFFFLNEMSVPSNKPQIPFWTLFFCPLGFDVFAFFFHSGGNYLEMHRRDLQKKRVSSAHRNRIIITGGAISPFFFLNNRPIIYFIFFVRFCLVAIRHVENLERERKDKGGGQESNVGGGVRGNYHSVPAASSKR